MGGRLKIDVTGQRFGRLKVLHLVEGQTDTKHLLYLCLCDCGKETFATSTALRMGVKTSCGCWKTEEVKMRMTTHGLAETKGYYMWTAAKRRAKAEGLTFSLAPQDVSVPRVCPVLGIELQTGNHTATHNSPSLDRLIPSLGYVKGNVNVISYKANTIKSDATLEELQKVTKWFSKEIKKWQKTKQKNLKT
jgi:hypothetical protein